MNRKKEKRHSGIKVINFLCKINFSTKFEKEEKIPQKPLFVHW